MYYYKQLNEDGNLLCLLTYDQKPNVNDPLTVEINEQEYMQIRGEIKSAEEDEEPDTTIEDKAMAYDILTGEAE